jgi:murein L,D-transpeptidase YafK
MPELRITLKITAVALCALCWTSLSHGNANERAERVLIRKSDRTLQLLKGGKAFKTYKVALGPNPVGHKEKEGDGRTPEGTYFIDYRNARSQFHRSLHISYPSARDRASALRRGVRPGGSIMIHGLGKQWGFVGGAHIARDWTLGCIAVTNEEIEEIWAMVPDGTPVDILP